jgi:tryptophanyl-tRNA synthetase
LRENMYSTAAAWLAFGLNTEKTVFYKQSDVAITTELAWILSTYFPYQRLTLAHSFKDKSDNLKDVNVGLFTYPMLMAADILLYDSNFVPVGKDQLQHLEITRDVAIKFNNKHGETFVIPEAMINETTKYVTGTNGEKMSKSKGNIIDIFLPEKELKKQIMTIQTDSTPLELPKDYESCNVFKIIKLIAENNHVDEIKNKYKSGGYGYGHAKTELFEIILSKYKNQRDKYNHLMSNKKEIDAVLLDGASRAKATANEVLSRVKTKLGY